MFILICKRILIAIPQLIAISLVTFFLMQLTPGNYLESLKMDPQISDATIEQYQRMYKLDAPVWQQYLQWVKNLTHGELGRSFYYNVSVSKIIGSRLFNTFVLSFAAFVFTWAVAIPLGVWAALHRNRMIDRLIQLCSYAALATPSFFLAMLLLFVMSQTGLLPLGGMYSPHFEEFSWFGKIIDVLKHLVIPTLALSIGSIGGLQRIMRGNMLEVLGQQYITAARAKGLPEHRVIYRHALKNAFNPLITLLGFEFSSLLSGAALIEIMCSWPGLGSMMLTAVRSKDVYLVMASMLMGGILFLLGNLLADILLAWSDPRIRFEKSESN